VTLFIDYIRHRIDVDRLPSYFLPVKLI
jgi:hypothetical protein